MDIVLVGADLEENLGVGMIAAVAEDAGHRVAVVPFSDAAQKEQVLRRILSLQPDVLGLSIQFQHRAAEFLGLARRLRSRGFAGHITAGGQFPTLAYRQVLAGASGVDSVVLHDGEESFVALLAALAAGRPLAGVAGLAIRGGDGLPLRTADRRLVDDLDRFPFPRRYRPHTLHVGVPFIPIMGGRGCWGRCSFCSISSYYRDARAHGGGRILRHRSPENVAAEMAALWHQAGGRAVFCFHDDNLLLPRPADSLRRIEAIRRCLDRHGVGKAAFVGKCRPDSITPALAARLRELGVVRLFVGVENASQGGSDRLNRGVSIRQAHDALRACREAGIFCCYNLLIFEPGATVDDVAQNVDFLRQHAHYPVNFCRAEAYQGTQLQLGQAAAGNLSGSFLGHDYRVADDRAEVLFRVCAAAFRERNYARRGVHNRYMGLGYSAKLLEFFYDGPRERRTSLVSDAERLTRSIALETAAFLEEALALVRDVDLNDRDRIEGETALLGLRIAEADRYRHAELDRIFDDMQRFTVEQPATRAPRRSRLARAARRMAHTVAAVGMLGIGCVGASSCSDDDDRYDIWPTDDAPGPDIGDIWPTDDAPGPDSDTMVVDPAPDSGPDLDAAEDIWPTDDAPGPDAYSDPEGGAQDSSSDQARLSPDADEPRALASAALWQGAPRLIDQWGESGPGLTRRSPDLPLFAPPSVELHATRDAAGVRVQLRCVASPINTRWEGDGQVSGAGAEASWLPDCDSDQIRVGVRSRGGVAVAALRAKEIPAPPPKKG